MSEWNRGGRQDESRWQDRDDRRRGQDENRWSGASGSRETRSFDGRGSGDQDWLEAQRYGGENYAPYGGSGYPRQGGRERDYEARLQNPRYDEDRHAYGRPDYMRERGSGQQSYGRSGGQTAFGAQNEPLQRVADGEADHGWTGLAGHGEGLHRGRGPKNYTRSDDRIREDVNDRLSDDSWLDASEIEVQVSNCEVTLNGTVERREDKRRAEDIVERVSGVKHVQNNLRVQPQTQTSQTQSGQQTTAAQGSSAARSGAAQSTSASTSAASGQARPS